MVHCVAVYLHNLQCSICDKKCKRQAINYSETQGLPDGDCLHMHKKSSLITISASMSSKVVAIECMVYGDIVKAFKKKIS
jgi:hypothetical protein